MKLAFYYHIPLVVLRDGKLYLPGYLGIFVDALAREVEQLFLVMHTTSQVGLADYQIRSKNISIVDLGKKTPAWHRSIAYSKVLRKPLFKLNEVDAVLVRCPSPLAPYFSKFLPRRIKLFYYVVGNYGEAARYIKSEGLKSWVIKLYLYYNNYKLEKKFEETNIFVNSVELYNRYVKIAKSVEVVKSTTLTVNDFFERDDTCQLQTVNLIYTGRIDLAKGLIELLTATKNIISKSKKNVELHIVGWEEDLVNTPVQNTLIELARQYEISQNVIFHGKKKIGRELNLMYQMADIYVLPSYHEGFPRTIWEAMANSLPVITTRVGSIPEFLDDNIDCVLIQPKSSAEVEKAIQMIIDKKELRKRLIKNGLKKASQNTLKSQTKKLITLLNDKL